MTMQLPPAPRNYATVLFFYPSFSRVYCFNTCCPWWKYCHPRWRRKQVIWIESSRLCDLHSPTILTSRFAPGSKESWDKRHANPVWFKERKWIKWDSGWTNNMKLETLVPTQTCLHRIHTWNALNHILMQLSEIWDLIGEILSMHRNVCGGLWVCVFPGSYKHLINP